MGLCQEFIEYRDKAEIIYRDLFKFPPKMFQGAKLIDFGAGTGENTVYLANWGASCTLVEMNILSQNISKDVFKKYASNLEDHKFVLSSIFDYEDPAALGTYDIVHCRGVLSHTAGKEKAFQKIATYLKPGGFLIFGDPNKAGGFQNMLQRFAVYQFAKTPDEMVEVSEYLFKEDIDRSQQFVPRTRRCIIFDRWVIQSQDDPSVGEVVQWAQESGLKLYSAYPPVLMPVLGDSLHHQPKLDPYTLKNFFAIPELVWMLQTESDEESVGAISDELAGFSESMSEIAFYMGNFDSSSHLDPKVFKDLSDSLQGSMENLRILNPVK